MTEKHKIILSSSVLIISILLSFLLYFNVDSRTPFNAFILIFPSLVIALVSYKFDKEIEIVSTMLSVVGILYFLITLPTNGIIMNFTEKSSTYIIIFLASFFLMFDIYYMFTKSDD